MATRAAALFSSENSKFVMDECVVEGNTANARQVVEYPSRVATLHAASLTFCKISNNRVLHSMDFGGGLYTRIRRVR